MFFCSDSDDEEEDEDVKTAFKPQVILEPKVCNHQWLDHQPCWERLSSSALLPDQRG